MKSLVVFCVLAHFGAQSAHLPAIITSHLCRKSDPDYSGCSLKKLRENYPNLVKGIPEYGIRSLDPLEVPYVSLNESLSEFLNFTSVFRGIKVTGLKDLSFDHFKSNLKILTAELAVSIPFVHVEAYFAVTGRLGESTLGNSGFFMGNFTDLKVIIRGSMKTVDRNGETYFTLDKLRDKISIGDGEIQLKTHDPKWESTAEFIQNTFNSNPQEVLNTLISTFSETLEEIHASFIQQGLDLAPAREWLPE